jgi:hypothetical protein
VVGEDEAVGGSVGEMDITSQLVRTEKSKRRALRRPSFGEGEGEGE